jgi:S-adenosyl-L-methionine hydrolase (adenosine-forming)
MKIITLTTDMGLTDHYVASLKGAILKSLQDVHIVDVTHNIQAFDISQAAYTVKSCFSDFPKGTIHVVGIDSEPVINFGSPHLSSLPAILVYQEQIFVCNDNGFFSLLVGENEFDSIWHVDDVLSKPDAFKFPAKNILISIAVQIAKGIPLEKIATQVDSFKRMIALNPIIEQNLIIGNVQHIDFYGNIITNIDKKLFYRFGDNIPFTIFFRKKEYYIDTISSTYGDVTPGERLAFFNNNDLLEISINRGANSRNGGASSLFGLKLNDPIRIEFSPSGSKQTIDSLF